MSKETCKDCPNLLYNQHRKQRLERLEEGIARAELTLSAYGLRQTLTGERRHLKSWITNKLFELKVHREEGPSLESIEACEGPFTRNRNQNYAYTLQQSVCGADVENYIEEHRIDPTRALYNDAATEDEITIVENS